MLGIPPPKHDSANCTRTDCNWCTARPSSYAGGTSSKRKITVAADSNERAKCSRIDNSSSPPVDTASIPTVVLSDDEKMPGEKSSSATTSVPKKRTVKTTTKVQTIRPPSSKLSPGRLSSNTPVSATTSRSHGRLSPDNSRPTKAQRHDSKLSPGSAPRKRKALSSDKPSVEAAVSSSKSGLASDTITQTRRDDPSSAITPPGRPDSISETDNITVQASVLPGRTETRRDVFATTKYNDRKSARSRSRSPRRNRHARTRSHRRSRSPRRYTRCIISVHNLRYQRKAKFIMNRKDSFDELKRVCLLEWPMSPKDSQLVWKGAPCRGNDWLYHVLESGRDWTDEYVHLCDSTDIQVVLQRTESPRRNASPAKPKAVQAIKLIGPINIPAKPDTSPLISPTPSRSRYGPSSLGALSDGPSSSRGPLSDTTTTLSPAPTIGLRVRLDDPSSSASLQRQIDNTNVLTPHVREDKENQPPNAPTEVIVLSAEQRRAFREQQKAAGQVLLGELQTLWHQLDTPGQDSALLTIESIPARLLPHMKKGRKYVELGLQHGLNVASKKSRAHYNRVAGSFEAGTQELFDAIDHHNTYVLGWRQVVPPNDA